MKGSVRTSIRLSHLTEATAYQCGTIRRNGCAVIGSERLTVHE